MDNSPSAVFTPDRRLTALAGAGVLVAVLIAMFSGDREGRVLAGVAAVVLAASAISDLIFSPRLEASAAGLVVRSPFTRAAVGWSEVESVSIVSRTRLGLRNTALEVDAGEVLAEFTRRTLGAELEDALARIQAQRPG